jgi:hypothetical protein
MRLWKKERINPRSWESFTNKVNLTRCVVCRNTNINSPKRWKIIVSYDPNNRKIINGFKRKKDALKGLKRISI